MSGLDVLTIGRVSVDLYPEQVGVPLSCVHTFRKMLGGSATNVAVAAAQLGRRASVITKVGADAFGDYVREALEEFGVDATRVGTHPTLRTPLAFCELFPPDRFPLLFYREPKAPDLERRPPTSSSPKSRQSRSSGRPAPGSRRSRAARRLSRRCVRGEAGRSRSTISTTGRLSGRLDRRLRSGTVRRSRM